MPDKPRRKNNQGSVYYDKENNKYRAAITLDDGKRATKRFDTEQEAEDWVALKRAEIGLGTFIAPSEVKFGEYIADWLETHVKTEVRQRTYDRYITLLSHMDKIASKPVQLITATSLKKLYNNIKVKRTRKDPATGKKVITEYPASGETKKKVHNLVRSCLNQARIDQLIQRNPADDVTAPKVTRKEIETFTDNEISKILETAKKMRNLTQSEIHQWYPAVYMDIVTGLRMSELFGLRRMDITNGVLFIRQGLHLTAAGEIIFEETKSAAGRRKLALPPEYIPVIEKHMAKALEDNPETTTAESLVFTSTSGTPINPQNWQRFWRKLLRQAGIPHKNFHALRHTHATRLLANGVPLLEVSRRLGHSKPSHTLDLYGHAIPGYDDKIASQIGEIYNLKDESEEENKDDDK